MRQDRVRSLRSDFIQPAEARWFDLLDHADVEGLALLFMANAALKPNVAFGLARFVDSRQRRKEDYLASDTRSRYRKLLTELDPATIGDDQFRGSSIGAAA